MSKKRYKTTKPIQPSYKAQLAYNKALNSFIDQIEQDIAEYREILKDGIFDTVETMLKIIISFATKDTWIKKTVDKFLGTADKIHLKKFEEGLELIGFKEIHTASVDKLLSARRAKNIALIKSIPQQLHNRLNIRLYKAYENGDNLLEVLEKEFRVSKRRAKLIARDQTAKTNAYLNQVRAEANGSTKYRWRTSKDERVRDTHKDLDGKLFDWKDGSPCCGHPSSDVNCRCLGLAVYEI